MDSGALGGALNAILENPELLQKAVAALPALTQLLSPAPPGAPPAPPAADGSAAAAPPMPPPLAEGGAGRARSPEEVRAALAVIMEALGLAAAPSQERPSPEANETSPVTAGAGAAVPADAAAPAIALPVESQAPPAASPANLQGALAPLLAALGAGGGGGAAAGAPFVGIDRALAALGQPGAQASPKPDNRVSLLMAIRPFLKDERQGKIDKAVKYLNAAKIFTALGSGGAGLGI